jgi:hypothetical protein
MLCPAIVTIQCLRFDCTQHKKFGIPKMANLIIFCIFVNHQLPTVDCGLPTD